MDDPGSDPVYAALMTGVHIRTDIPTSGKNRTNKSFRLILKLPHNQWRLLFCISDVIGDALIKTEILWLSCRRQTTSFTALSSGIFDEIVWCQ